MKDMLGILVRRVVDLPLEMLGTICDLVEKLSGETGQQWLVELKKFLRKEKCWTGIVKEIFLNLISGGEKLTIDAVDGSEIIAGSDDMFKAGIDSDFVEWGANERGVATSETSVEVYELVKNATLAQMFGSLCADVGKICLTQHQIKNFIRKHRDWLRKDGYATLFLFKSNNQFFVAKVRLYSVGRLNVDVYQFEGDDLWNAEYRRRFVVPQLSA